MDGMSNETGTQAGLYGRLGGDRCDLRVGDPGTARRRSNLESLGGRRGSTRAATRSGRVDPVWLALAAIWAAIVCGWCWVGLPGMSGAEAAVAPAATASLPGAAAANQATGVVASLGYCRLARFELHDGDTFTHVDLELPYGFAWRELELRVDGFDAWETTRARRTVGEITPAELAQGRAATADAQTYLAQADAVYVQAEVRARWTYERLLGTVWVDPPGPDRTLINFGDWMRGRGHARPTDPVLEREAKAKAKAAAKKVSDVLFRAK
jgi:hypothetical protein